MDSATSPSEITNIYQYLVNQSKYDNKEITTFSTPSDNNFAEMLKYSIEWTVVIVCAYLTIFIVGLAGNGLVICVLVFRPQLRTVTNMFMLNLAGKIPNFFY